MTVTFVSNYLTMHQIPFCEIMYSHLGDDFKFVNTEQMESERISMGWENDKRYPFEIDLQQAGNLIDESDVVIIGSAGNTSVDNRIRNNKPVIRYSERILKKGRWHVLSPRAVISMVKSHTQYSNKKVWMLCASAYAAGDYGLFGAYRGKCYKWGYFPKTFRYSEEQIQANKNTGIVRILWCGRFLNWKHPEAAVLVARHLNEKKIPFHMDIIGDGEMKEDIQMMIAQHHLESDVSMHGFLAPNEVREYMDRSDIFLFTSDFNEGWGAVLNEAMNSGCACVASHAIGAAPYLIRDEVNGFLYRNGNIKQLCDRVYALAANRELRRTVGINAYHTITDEWNADVAAKRLLCFCEAIVQEKKIPEYDEGPMSKAGFLSNRWYQKGKR